LPKAESHAIRYLSAGSKAAAPDAWSGKNEQGDAIETSGTQPENGARIFYV
jgi:hypothetical protein